MAAFFSNDGVIYRHLMADDMHVWLIRYDRPGSPLPVSYEMFATMEQVPAPENFMVAVPAGKTQSKRMDAIKLLIADEACITDKQYRNGLIAAVTNRNGLSGRTVRKWYYAYLAGGAARLCPQPRKREKKTLSQEQKNFRYAINRYYYSARRMSLRSAYDMMLLDKYTDYDGGLVEGYPSFYQFRYFHYSRASDPVKKLIAREGISQYQRNARPLYGNASNGAEAVGVYQMDATVADVFLVSRHNRKQIIGRPYIYIAVDVASRLIAGVYVGLDAGEEAVTECLRQAASDKPEYCKRYGIDIVAGDWPSQGLPAEIITDRGREFLGKRMDELCEQYGIVSTGLPPYRPDLKGLVEYALHALQERYKYVLKRLGVVEPDFQDRGAPDYRREATLNLEEFTRVVIHGILYINSQNVLKGYIRTPEMAEADVKPIAANIWNWLAENEHSNIIPISEADTCYALLPRATGKFTRNGLAFRGLHYQHPDYNSRCAAAGLNGKEEVQIAYDPVCTDCIYLLEDGEYIKFELTKASERFHSSSYADVQRFLAQERENKKALTDAEVKGRVSCAGSIKKIAKAALAERGDLQEKATVDNIAESREAEKAGMRP